MIHPPKPTPDDKVVIVSPASGIDPEWVKGATQVLREWGLRVEIAEHALNHAGRFSDSAEHRLRDLQKAMNDPDVKLIFCARGGYGAVHLLDKLDFEEIRKKPKWLLGFSDITVLHAAFQKNNIMSIHGPMAKHFAEEGISDVSVRHVRDILFMRPIQYELPAGKLSGLNRAGETSGSLFGGNLAVFCGLLGTPYVEIPINGLLFIEDIGEEPYKVDRYIHQLKHAGVFDKIGGLIVGQFTDFTEDTGMYRPFYETIADCVKEYTFPVAFDFPIGHVRHNLPVIMGNIAKLSVNEEKITFKQI